MTLFRVEWARTYIHLYILINLNIFSDLFVACCNALIELENALITIVAF